MRPIRAVVSAIAVAAIALHASAAPVASLTDQSGQRLSLADFRGHPTVLTFISAHCTDACPLIEAQIAAAAAHEKTTGGRMRFITITIDPQRDSFADLRRIAREFDADASYWHVPRAEPEPTRDLMRRFDVVAARDGAGYETMHSTFVYILDRSGRYVGSIMPSTRLTSQLAIAEEF